MAEKPILFNGEMMRAILCGSKTQTRRVVKPQPKMAMYPHMETKDWWAEDDGTGTPVRKINCPYGRPGDLLWVRETFAENIPGCEAQSGLSYRADHLTGNDGPTDIKWRPSIFMPRWASRLLLQVTDVRVERLKDITEEDAIAEGCSDWIPSVGYTGLRGVTIRGLLRQGTHREYFQLLWDSINEKRGYGWDSNPWVWVVNFEETK